MEWGNEVPTYLFPKLVIHTWGWIPSEVGVGWTLPKKNEEGQDIGVAQQGLHSLKYLGIHIDSNNFHEKLFQETLRIIRSMCRVIGSKKATADLKACSIFLRVITMATYRGSVGPWSLERLREWDKPVEALYRKIHSCMSCLSKEILYMSPAEGQVGLGLPCLSDRCQEEKWAKLHRAMITGGDSAVAAEGLLLRAARICGKPVIANCGVTLEVVKDDYLLRSVIEWGATANRHLRFGGPDPVGTSNELATSVINDESLIETLEGMDAVTLGDLTEIVEEKGTHVRKWVSRKKLRAAKLCESNEAAEKI